MHRIIASLPILMVLVWAPVAMAQTTLPEASIAVLDYRRIIRESEAAKDIRAKVDVYREGYRKSFSAEERRVRQGISELKARRKVLSADAFARERASYEAQIKDLQRRIQDRKNGLDRAFDQAIGQVQKAIVPIVQSITVAKGYNLVVDASNVLFAAKTMDITSEVLAVLDKQLPRVELVKLED